MANKTKNKKGRVLPDFDGDITDINIQEKDILEPPSTDIDGMVDLMLVEDDFPQILDSKEDIADIKNYADGMTHLPDSTPIVCKPSDMPSVAPTPVVNNANNILSVNVKKGSSLQKFIGNPIDNDPLVEAIRSEASTATIFNAIMEEMAEEAAFIKAWRNEKWDGNTDLSEATSKRIKMLKDLVETLMEKEKLKKEKNVGKIDFYGDNFQRVLKHFLEVIQKTFKKVNIPAQFEDIFFTQLAKEFDGFEKSAEKTYYGKD